MPSPLDPFRLPLRLAGDLTRIADAVAELPRISRLLRDVHQDVGLLRGEIDGLTKSLTTMEHQLEASRRASTPLDVDLASVERGVHALPPKMDQMATELTALRADLASVPFVGRDTPSPK